MYNIFEYIILCCGYVGVVSVLEFVMYVNKIEIKLLRKYI